jgi:hypothetical protein
MVLLYALAPKPGAAELALSLAALAIAGVGFSAMINLRTWGVMAVGLSGGLLLSLAGFELVTHTNELHALRPALGGSLLVLAAAPWATPILRYFR